MLILLPIVVFVMVVVAERRHVDSLREAVLFSAVVVGILTVVSTEVLSCFHLLTFAGIVGFWVVVLVGGFFYGRNGPRRQLLWGKWTLSPALWVLAGWCFVYVFIIGLLAWLCPPNVWDGLTYHMPRVMHWIQNQSVAFYPTHILRQLHLSPGAEYAILHAQVLSGGDRFANMVQWAALVGCLLAGSCVARQLGAKAPGQWMTGVFILTLPAGILQASNVQTDFVVSFWLILLVFYLIACYRNPAWRTAFLAGGCLGLALLTKGTAFLFAAPLVMSYVAFAWRVDVKRYVLMLSVMAGITLVLNGPFWLRNQQFYGSPLGPGQEGSGTDFKYGNDRLSAGVLLSNISRNFALHAVQPVSGIRVGVDAGVRALHDWVGLDIDDPETTWTGTAFYISDMWGHEVHAGNPLHVVLILICGCCMCLPVWFRKKGNQKLIWMLFISAWCSMVLFSLILRWQPWGARLHLPFFVLVAPCLGVVFSSVMGRRVVYGLSVLLLLCALPWMLFNSLRPLVGDASVFSAARSDQYFASAPYLREPYMVISEYIAQIQPKQVGLFLGPDDPEYLVWQVCSRADMKISHYQVENSSQRLNAVVAEPGVILVSRDLNRIELDGQIIDLYNSTPLSPYTIIKRP